VGLSATGMAAPGVPEVAFPALVRGGFPELFRSPFVPCWLDVLPAPGSFLPGGVTNGSLPGLSIGAAAFLAV
jgi:hypothetical protein